MTGGWIHPPIVPKGPTTPFDPSEQRNLPPRTREQEEIERSEFFDEEDEDDEEPPPPLSFLSSSSSVSLSAEGLAIPTSSIRLRREPLEGEEEEKNGRRETVVGGEVMSGVGGDGAVGALSALFAVTASRASAAPAVKSAGRTNMMETRRERMGALLCERRRTRITERTSEGLEERRSGKKEFFLSKERKNERERGRRRKRGQHFLFELDPCSSMVGSDFFFDLDLIFFSFLYLHCSKLNSLSLSFSLLLWRLFVFFGVRAREARDCLEK